MWNANGKYIEKMTDKSKIKKPSDSLKFIKLTQEEIKSINVLKKMIGFQAGTISYYARDSAPPGWLVCDGSTLSQTIYKKLFEAIGHMYIDNYDNIELHNKNKTFMIPNLNSVFIRSYDDRPIYKEETITKAWDSPELFGGEIKKKKDYDIKDIKWKSQHDDLLGDIYIPSGGVMFGKEIHKPKNSYVIKHKTIPKLWIWFIKDESVIKMVGWSVDIKTKVIGYKGSKYVNKTKINNDNNRLDKERTGIWDDKINHDIQLDGNKAHNHGSNTTSISGNHTHTIGSSGRHSHQISTHQDNFNADGDIKAIASWGANDKGVSRSHHSTENSGEHGHVLKEVEHKHSVDIEKVGGDCKPKNYSLLVCIKCY